jgi:zinc transporter ZupT
MMGNGAMTLTTLMHLLLKRFLGCLMGPFILMAVSVRFVVHSLIGLGIFRLSLAALYIHNHSGKGPHMSYSRQTII